MREIESGKLVKEFEPSIFAALYNRVRWAPDGRSVVYQDFIGGLWRQKLTGEPPTKLPGFDDIRVFHFNFTRDGKIIYSGGLENRNMVLFEPAS